MITQLPGFADTVHDAQRTFRALLDSLARPSQIQTTATLTPPLGLCPSAAAACLTLLDLETLVWLQPGMAEETRSWLVFHTGCRFTPAPQAAQFALIEDISTAPALADFNHGTAEYPESSTSLLIQLPGLTGGTTVTAQGPGILDPISVEVPLPPGFWHQWQSMTAAYPLGVDVWCLADNQVMGFPRTTQVRF